MEIEELEASGMCKYVFKVTVTPKSECQEENFFHIFHALQLLGLEIIPDSLPVHLPRKAGAFHSHWYLRKTDLP